MFGAWLGDVTLAEFRARYLQREAFARPSSALATVPKLDWSVLARVLVADPPPDTLVVARGKRLEVPAPRSLADLGALFAAGVGLCLRHTERCDPGLAAIAADFERELGSAQVQLFVTPPRTHGFTWHYDDEDVFIVQTLGTKEYLFRANTVAPETTAHASVFQRFAEERSPICAATLVPGDFLYIPARWWHMAECRGGDPSLSISVGVRPRGAGLAPDPGQEAS
ncbi:MAG: hypothetical protein H0T46_24670 [Deltaproteobacteria bacterium]|nr:hypothetical protein [Deltaproteobacteria bacterium]